MNGGQDLGGMMGFGPVIQEPNEPNFHEAWEARVLALTLAMGSLGFWNIDKSRHAREVLHPVKYLSWSYYQIWLAGLEKLLLDHDLISQNELEDGHAAGPSNKQFSVLKPENVAASLAKGGPANRPHSTQARFNVGDEVATRRFSREHHTRLARYLRGVRGKIVKVHGVHVFPDSNAQGLGENPQWLYTVQIKATELWGDDKNPNDCVNAELWEPYFV